METLTLVAIIAGGISLFLTLLRLLFCAFRLKSDSDREKLRAAAASNVHLVNSKSDVYDSIDIESQTPDFEVFLGSLASKKTTVLNGSASLEDFRNALRSELPLLPSGNVSKKTVFAWGDWEDGQLGLGRVESEEICRPTRLEFHERITSVFCGKSHTLFLLDDGSLWSCGSNDHGQLGCNSSHSRPKKIEGLGDTKIVGASCGLTHSIAVDHRGYLFAWGSDYYGQLGLQTKASVKIVNRPERVMSFLGQIVQQVSAGEYHSLAMTLTGEIYACGSNSNGQLGLGPDNKSNQTKFVLIQALVGFPCALITSGGHHSFALSVSGSVIGWGKNTFGQLGISGDTEDQWEPTELPTLKSVNVRFVAAGFDHTAFLTQDGGVFTCGSGKFGQLGHSSTSNEVLPRKILEFGKTVTQVACGRFHTLCWITDRLYSFGYNSNGQLGLGFSGECRNSPFHVKELSYVVDSVYAGGNQTMVLVEGLEVRPGSARRRSSMINRQPNTVVTIPDYRQPKRGQQCLRITDETMSKILSNSDTAMKFLEIVFKSPAVWNASFLTQKMGMSKVEFIGVDLLEAERILSKLEAIRSQSMKDRMNQFMVLHLLPDLQNVIRNAEMSRIYFLIPLIPHFYSGTNYQLSILYAANLLSLPAKIITELTRSLYSAPMEQILRLISVYKRTILTILERFEHNQNEEQRDVGLKQCLNFLNELNTRNRVGRRLSYHTFCIPQLTSKVDIRMDYIQWLQREARPGVYFCSYPFLFDAQTKTLLLQTDQIVQMKLAMQNAAASAHILGDLLPMIPAEVLEELTLRDQFLNLKVSRKNLIADVVQQITALDTNDLKKPLTISFIDEEAIDAGGVKKEFFLLLIREILDPKFGMFTNFEESRLMWFKAGTFEDEVMYLVIGMICGLAIYNSTIINLPFPLALYKKLLKEKTDLQDLKQLSTTEGQSLEKILEYEDADFEEVFGLNFAISQEYFGVVKSVELKPNGSMIPVTQENKREFVNLYVAYIFDVACAEQFEAFQIGFLRVCGSTVLQLFHPQELQAMVTGNEDYDWGELEQNCTYKEDYHETESTIKMFWEVFHGLSLFEKKQFLLFVTGSDRIPILGMKTLQLIIQPVGDDRCLPVAHTCFNLIDLPRYKTKERLKYKLLQAIQHNEGFELA